MNIGSICQREVVSIDALASLRDAAVLMRERHVGCLVVTTDGGGGPHAAGMLTDRDIVVDAVARGLDAAGVRVGQIASRKLAAVFDTASLQEAVAEMEKAGVRRLLVTDEHGAVTGLVSADDLLGAMTAELGGLARALRSGRARESAERGAAAPVRPVFRPYGTPGMPWPAMPPLPAVHGAAAGGVR